MEAAYKSTQKSNKQNKAKQEVLKAQIIAEKKVIETQRENEMKELKILKNQSLK